MKKMNVNTVRIVQDEFTGKYTVNYTDREGRRRQYLLKNFR